MVSLLNGTTKTATPLNSMVSFLYFFENLYHLRSPQCSRKKQFGLKSHYGLSSRNGFQGANLLQCEIGHGSNKACSHMTITETQKLHNTLKHEAV